VADLRPFFAYRPSAENVQGVAAPPYDVVTTAQARALAADNPHSFLHVSRPEIDLADGVDEHSDEVYAQGRTNLLALVENHALVRDEEAHLYVYAQRMGDHRQIGVVGCASVADYDGDRIKKHEKTRPDKEDDRTRHILELGAHDEPVFLTYRANTGVDGMVASIAETKPVYDFTSDDGVHHQLWVVNAERSNALASLFSDDVGDLYVADGHHRSAAASRVHDAMKGQGGEHDVFLVVVFPHDQMNILAYNRVVKDRQGRSGEALLDALRGKLDVVSIDDPVPDVPGSFGVYVGGGKWYRATALPGSFDANDPVGRLDCQICQDLILSPIFGIEDPRRDESIGFVGGIHGAAELERRVDAGEASIAIYLPATKMSQVMEVSDAGKVMPPKSTWFEPKLKSGLFVHMI
jgi:uncharacterized protein (DUF1015 family)